MLGNGIALIQMDINTNGKSNLLIWVAFSLFLLENASKCKNIKKTGLKADESCMKMQKMLY